MSTTYGPLTIFSPNGQYSSQGSDPNWQPSQFSKDDADTNGVGSGVHSYVGFNTLTVTVVRGVVTGFSLYVYSGGEGLATPYDQTYSGGSYTVTVNGSTFFTNSSSPLGSTFVSYTSPADGPPPVDVIIQGSITVSGRDGGLIMRTANSSFTVKYEFHTQTANLVFSAYDSSLPAPFSAKMIFLEPPSSLNNGKLIAIKDKSFQSASMNTWIYSPNGTKIEGGVPPAGATPGYDVDPNPAANLYQNGQCTTYIIDYPNNLYRILNIYPSNNQGEIPTGSIAGLTPVAMTNDIADIFSVDSGITPNRTTSNNLVQLPPVSNPPGQGSLKILVYGGRTSAKYGGNGLFIQEPVGGNLLDNTYSTVKPYIQTDSSANANEKNTGMIFISNENQWFILGYYYTFNWTWSITAPAPPTKTIPNNTLQFNLISLNANDMVNLPTIQALSVVKTQTVTGSGPYIVFREPGGGSTLNELAQFAYYNGDPTNSVTWILSYSVGVGATKNYIVAAYTPN
jgi:hypothetical protein